MVNSTSPLTRAELGKLLTALPTFRPKEGYYEALDAEKVIRFFLATGVHPTVLADPAKAELRMDGPRYVTWRRPKTDRVMRVPIGPDDAPWIGGFLADLPRRTEKTYNRLVQDMGTHAGLRGMTPRTLRHTFLRLLADKTRDIDDVMRWGGCSLKVAVGYVRTTDSERDKVILESGLLQGTK
jgi:integrase